jgi:hypothetical protein
LSNNGEGGSGGGGRDKLVSSLRSTSERELRRPGIGRRACVMPSVRAPWDVPCERGHINQVSISHLFDSGQSINFRNLRAYFLFSKRAGLAFDVRTLASVGTSAPLPPVSRPTPVRPCLAYYACPQACGPVRASGDCLRLLTSDTVARQQKDKEGDATLQWRIADLKPE